MAYTVLPTVSPGDTIASATWGNIVKANIEAIKAPPTDHYEANEASNYTTTSASLVDIDTDFELTITTTGGDIMVGFLGGFKCSAGAVMHLELDLDGSPVGGDDGIIGVDVGNTILPAALSFAYLITGVSAGSHTITLQWKTSGGTLTMYAGAGTSTADIHPQLWIREVS